MTKIYQIISLAALLAALVLGLMYSYEKNEKEAYKTKWQEALGQVENLKGRINAEVEAGKQKAELEKKMDSSKDTDNLKHVPDTDILEQLRSDPV